MERYICIHGHFYQPPRENPWLEAIEIQDSAYPYHDWNERINMECYAPNAVSRNLDGEGGILNIVNNYARISFNFGPTLLSWMSKNAPQTYEAIVDADKLSIKWRSGHGNALAQIYNHLIMPLANNRDKRTQIIWGIKDFEYRFKRFPEGMWLPETAVDYETLDLLAEYGIRFTILAPRQAWKVRKIGTCKWKDVSNSRIDPTRAYICMLQSGRSINIFFYDGPISQAVAFENLLNNGEEFANRLLSGFSDTRSWPQIVNIATDGETYGHHQKFGDMALAHALNYIESNGLARITNYGEYLEKHPPTHEVQIFENSSWSCIHGIERWRNNCGCNSGMNFGWHQEWRKPLRDTLDWLRERLGLVYENMGSDYLKNPWEARDEYINVIFDRTEENLNRFLKNHLIRSINDKEKIFILKLLEMQRHSMLMYTSCGWFFDDISGIETVQILQYASRAIQLSEELFTDNLENTFKARLSQAKSNIAEYDNGAIVYNKFVKPSIIDLKKVAAHYAISSLFEDYIEETTVDSYIVTKKDYQRLHAGSIKLAVGKVSIASKITRENEDISFCVLHFGGHALNGGVRTFLGVTSYQSMKNEIIKTFEKGDFADIVRLMDQHFGMHNYSLFNLFKDQQRIILNSLISKTLEEFENSFRLIYENNKILMGYLLEIGMPVNKAFYSAAEFILNVDLKRFFIEEEIDVAKLRNLINEMKRWNVPIDEIDIEFALRRRLEKLMEEFYKNPSDFELLLKLQGMLELKGLLPLKVVYWEIQNIYYKIVTTSYRDFLTKSKQGDNNAIKWLKNFKYIGELLFFNIESILPKD